MSGRGRTTAHFLQDGRGGGRGRGGPRGSGRMYADRDNGGGGGIDHRRQNDYIHFTSNKSRSIQRKSRVNPFLSRDEDVPMGGDEERVSRGPIHSGTAYNGTRSTRGGRGSKKWRHLNSQGRGDGHGGHNFGPGWHKVLIINGTLYDREFLLNTLISLSRVPFRPVAYTRLGVNTVFFVEDRTCAEALASCSGRFSGPDSQKIILKVDSYGSPPTATIDAACEERIKAVLATRYDPTVPALSLQSFHSSQEFVLDFYLPVYRPSVVAKIFALTGEILPTLVSLDLSNNKMTSLDSFQKLPQLTPALKKLNLGNNRLRDIYTMERLRGLFINEIRLENNPLCDKFEDKEHYIRAVRKYFPKVTTLDGVEVAPVIKFDLEDDEIIIPIIKPGFSCNEDARKVVFTFVEQYMRIYDSDRRDSLMDAYHDRAVMTLQATYAKQGNTSSDHPTTKLSSYIGDSRNYVRTQDVERLKRGLHTGKLDIVAFLGRLPKTTHDISGFYIDLPIALPSLIHFSIFGVFKERGGEREMSMRSFHRSFSLVPLNGGFVIVNEMLFVTNATNEQAKAAFKVQAPTPSPSPVPQLQSLSLLSLQPGPVLGAGSIISLSDAEKQTQMVAQFAQESAMNESWSRKCLEQNLWDYAKSAHVFMELHKNGQIPPDAFIK